MKKVKHAARFLFDVAVGIVIGYLAGRMANK